MSKSYLFVGVLEAAKERRTSQAVAQSLPSTRSRAKFATVKGKHGTDGIHGSGRATWTNGFGDESARVTGSLGACHALESAS